MTSQVLFLGLGSSSAENKWSTCSWELIRFYLGKQDHKKCMHSSMYIYKCVCHVMINTMKNNKADWVERDNEGWWWCVCVYVCAGGRRVLFNTGRSEKTMWWRECLADTWRKCGNQWCHYLAKCEPGGGERQRPWGRKVTGSVRKHKAAREEEAGRKEAEERAEASEARSRRAL